MPACLRAPCTPPLCGRSLNATRIPTRPPHRSPPSAEITLEEFELYALDRLQVLRTIESLRLRAVKGDEFRMKLEEVLHKCLPMSGTEAEVKKDQISHFILRIAYCKMCVRMMKGREGRMEGKGEHACIDDSSPSIYAQQGGPAAVVPEAGERPLPLPP